eukprot:510451-Amorphochlora_amoeboformis.AAC.1
MEEESKEEREFKIGQMAREKGKGKELAERGEKWESVGKKICGNTFRFTHPKAEELAGYIQEICQGVCVGIYR